MKQFFCASALLLSFLTLALGFCCVRFSVSESGELLSITAVSDEDGTRLHLNLSNRFSSGVRSVFGTAWEALRGLPFFVRDAAELLENEAQGVFSLFFTITDEDPANGALEI